MSSKSGTDSRYDVIIIGSGIGGLTTASLLAQLHRKRVLILERHFKIGGFTHTFRRQGKYEWDVGLHYVGEMGIGDMSRAVFDLITEGKVDWSKMPEIYDRFVFPDFTFDARASLQTLKSDFVARFPHEQAGIERYFKDLKSARGWLTRYSISQAMPRWLRPLVWLIRHYGTKRALVTTGEYFDRMFKDEKLKSVLTAQWGLYGLPPSMSAFVGHALLVNHYGNGGYYPVGGSAVIADSIVPIVERHGGAALVNHSVEEILIDNGRAIGVRVAHKKGKEMIDKSYFADAVISNAGAHTTFTRMMPEGLNLPCAEAVRRFPNGTSNVTLYLGLNDDPASLGFHGENYWIYSGYHHDDIHEQRNDLVHGKVSHAYLSFPSCKNPKAKGHTAEIISFVDVDPFLEWENQPWRRRGEAYEALKKSISDALVAFVEQRFPGFAALIDYRELGTPITTEYFTNHRNGNIYGLPMVPDKFRSKCVSPYTPIRNLYLTGSDAAFFGIVGAMMSGVLTTAVAMRRPWTVISIFSKAMQFSKQIHAR